MSEVHRLGDVANRKTSTGNTDPLITLSRYSSSRPGTAAPRCGTTGGDIRVIRLAIARVLVRVVRPGWPGEIGERRKR